LWCVFLLGAVCYAKKRARFWVKNAHVSVYLTFIFSANTVFKHLQINPFFT